MAQNDEKWPRFFLLAVFLNFHLTLERNLPGFKFFSRDLSWSFVKVVHV